MLIGPPLGSIVMEIYSPQISFLCTLPPRALSLVFLFLIPETSQKKEATSQETSLAGPRKSLLTIIHGKIQNFSHHVVHDIFPIISQLPVMLGLISFIVNSFAIPLLGLVLQYMSSRFRWKLSQVRSRQIAVCCWLT
jgi:hypothetical protein